MELILLEKVLNLGDLGDKVKVKPGYGRNFLVPQGKAIPATKANLAEFEARRAELEKAAMAKLSTAEDRLKALEGFEITLAANASEEGKLYGSIGPREIADAVAAQGPKLEKAEVIMGEGPIRYTGEHDVLIHTHATTVSSGDWRMRSLEVPAGFGLILRLMAGVRKLGCQVIATSLQADPAIFGGEGTVFHVEHGVLTPA